MLWVQVGGRAGLGWTRYWCGLAGETLTSDLPDAPPSTPDPSHSSLGLLSSSLPGEAPRPERPAVTGSKDSASPAQRQPHYSRQFSGIGSHSLLSHNPLTFSAGAGVHHPHRSKEDASVHLQERLWTVLQTRLDVTARVTGFPPPTTPPHKTEALGVGLLSAPCIT